MTALTFKKNLREHFLNSYSNDELMQWFDPLIFSFSHMDKTLWITFPHIYFEQWFFNSIHTQFSYLAKQCLDGITIQYHPTVQNTQTPYIEPISDPVKIKNISSSESEPIPTAQLPLEDNTFGSFLANKKNDFPLAAAQEAVFNYDSPPFSPFIVYGPSGSGKTHLLEAMINSLQQYCSAPFFYGCIEEFISFLQNYPLSKTNIPKKQCFFIDDVQRLNDAQPLQKQCIPYLDMLFRSKKLVVLTFDAHPNSYQNFTTKFSSRLTHGLIIELKKPDLDIRRRYIQTMNTQFSLGMDKENILSLAQRHQDFRTIAGILTRIKAYRLLVKHDPIPLHQLLDVSSNKQALLPETIISVTAKFFSLSPDEITGKKRDVKSTEARLYAVYLCRDLLGLSLVQLGSLFGNRDHSSISYLIKKIKDKQLTDKDMNNTLSQLKRLCLSEGFL